MVCVVAEIGINHQGSLNLAHTLINHAAQAGADAVKFQLYRPFLLSPPGPWRDMLKTLALPTGLYPDLKAYAEALDLEFLCTPFDVMSLEFLVDMGVKRLKISSGGLRDMALLEAARSSGLDLILSTGMATVSDIREAMRALNWPKVFMLQCTSCYPTRPSDVHLRVMDTYRREFDALPGLSDHTTGIAVPIAATALGAKMIEKHLTLDRDAEGPDHQASIEPAQFKAMVEGIREAEQALGSDEKAPLDCEAPVMKIRNEREKWRSL